MDAYCNDVNDWLTVGGDLDLAEHVGGQDYDVTIDSLRQRGVTHVLDLRQEWEDRLWWELSGLQAQNYHHAPIVDSRSYVPTEGWFQSVERFVAGFWDDSAHGDRLYVHCMMGINRGPSAAMLALLTVEPDMHPFDAFLRVREARPCAGVVYAKYVGVRHLLNSEAITAEQLTAGMPESVLTFNDCLERYWTPEREAARRELAWGRRLDTRLSPVVR